MKHCSDQLSRTKEARPDNGQNKENPPAKPGRTAARNKCEICLKKVPPSLAIWHKREFHVDDRTVSTCPCCGAVFGTPQLLQSHLDADDECRTMYNSGRTLPGRYSCEKCGLRLDGGHVIVLGHLAWLHGDKACKRLICGKCGKVFFHPNLLILHYLAKHPDANEEPIRTFSQLHNEHQLKRKRPGPVLRQTVSNVQCVYCYAEFPSMPDMLRHVTQTHETEAAKLCVSFVHLSEPETVALGQKAMNKGLLLIESDREEETASVGAVSRMECIFCDAEYSTMSDMLDHVQQSHKKEGATRCYLDKKCPTLERDFHVPLAHPDSPCRCCFCPAVDSVMSLDDHVVQNHARLVDARSCEVCGRIQDGEPQLVEHLVFCMRQAGTSAAPSDDKLQRLLADHVVTRRNGCWSTDTGCKLCLYGELRCSGCPPQGCFYGGLPVRDYSSLRKHAKRKHPDEIAACPLPVCGKNFLSKQQRQLHFVLDH